MSRGGRERPGRHRRKVREEKVLCGGNDSARYDRSVCITRQERTPGKCRGCARFRGR